MICLLSWNHQMQKVMVKKGFLDKAIEILDFKLIWLNGASIHISEVIIYFCRKQKGQFAFHNGA